MARRCVGVKHGDLGDAPEGWCGGGAAPSEGTLRGGPRRYPVGGGRGMSQRQAAAVGESAAKAGPAWKRSQDRTPPL